LVARHRLQNVGGFAELAARKRGLRHRAHQVVNGSSLGDIQRLQRNQPVGHRIVQLAVDSRAFRMTAVLRDTFVLLGQPPE